MEAMMADRRLHAIVQGRVQGVNFRWYTRQRATQLGLTGWVRNLSGGRRVEVVAEGPSDRLGELVLFLHQGPPSAFVDQVEVTWAEATGDFRDFGVRF
jgi:acylphosphatase